MNYQEIVNRIQDVVNQHYMLAGFGYGDLSDLKVRFENTSGDDSVQADYPYLFLNPATHTRTQSAVTYNFNMLVMDLPRGEVSDNPYDNILAIQSQCQQYIDDVIAYLWNGYTDPPQVLFDSLSYNTFNERFQDDVAGMTVNLQIMVPQPINNCISPFPSPIPPVEYRQVYTLIDSESGSWVTLDALEAYCLYIDSNGPWNGPVFNIPVGTQVEVGTQFYDSVGIPILTSGTYIIDSTYEPFTPLTAVNPLVLEIVDGVVIDITVGSTIVCPESCESELPIFSIDRNDFTYNHDSDLNNFWRWETDIQQDVNIATWADIFLQSIQVSGTYEILIQQTLRFAQPVGNEVLPQRPVLRLSFSQNIQPTCDSDNWPTVWTDQDIEYTAKWVVDINAGSSLSVISMIDQPAPESAVTQLPGGTITIGYEAPPPFPLLALDYTNTTTRTLSNTNAAFWFETETQDTNWFVGAAFSNYYCEKTVPFDATISFDGTITYNGSFNPSLYQLAIYNTEQNLFFGMTDLPLSGGAVSITSDIFQYLPAETDPFGDPVQEIQFLTLYEKGTANPINNPPARFANPFTYNGRFKINVISE